MKQMTAQEVLQRYRNGERDFRRINLCGQSFKGQNLAEADFSEADIRSTNFAKANLSQTNFSGAIGGIQKRWWLMQQLLALIIAVLSSFLSTFSGGLIAYMLFHPDNDATQSFPQAVDKALQVNAVVILLILAVTMLSTALQGFTTKILKSITVTVNVFVVVFVVVFIGYPIFFAAFVSNFPGLAVTRPTISGLLAGFLAGAAAIFVAVTFFVAVAVAVAGPVAVAVAVAGTFAYYVITFFFTSTEAVTAPRLIGDVAVAGAFAIYSVYIAWETRKGNEKFSLLRTWSNAFGAIGGTSFVGADLTGANFQQTVLKSTNLQTANFTQVSWRDAKNHDLAHWGKQDLTRWGASVLANQKVRQLLMSGNGAGRNYQNIDLRGVNLEAANLRGASVLANQKVRQLLMSGNGAGRDYQNIDLHGVNLAAANLTEANLSHANLSRSTLRYANLKNANLRETLCIETDFTGVDLTGACIQGWKIDHTTKLDNIECQYVFLLERENTDGSRERRPHDPDKVFEPGDFEKLCQMNTASSKINLSAISGAVTNTINELPDRQDSQESSLKELLIQLQQAIETDKDLQDPDKADLLEQVQNLATAGQTETLAEKEGLTRKAKNMFAATLSTLPDTAKIVEAVSKLLPIILKVLGVPV